MEWLVLIGVSTGMRTMTAIAVLCWFARLGLLPQTGWSFWAGNIISVIVFTVCALGEYVGDTLPSTPSRKAPGPMAARLLFGSLSGAMAAHAMQEPIAGGIVFGVIGVLIGAFGGYRLRMLGARLIGRDLPVALVESTLALAFAVLSAWMLHLNHVVDVVRWSTLKT